MRVARDPPGLAITTLSVTDGDETRTVFHVHYTAWPDHGVPSNARDFVAILEAVQRLQARVSEKAGYTVVHCSAGVGRTGVLLLTWILIEKLRRGFLPDAQAVLVELREQRGVLVQTPEQFRFCFAAALAWLEARPPA